MAQYFVEVSHYIVNIYKKELGASFDDVKEISDLTNTKAKHYLLKNLVETSNREVEITKIDSFDNHIDVDTFSDGNCLVNDEILDVMSHIWKALPGKQIAVEKFIGSAKLDIRLNRIGHPVIYRIVWKTIWVDSENSSQG